MGESCQKSRVHHGKQVNQHTIFICTTVLKRVNQYIIFIWRKKQVAQWVTIAHLVTSIMFEDTCIIIDDAQRRITLNLKQ